MFLFCKVHIISIIDIFGLSDKVVAMLTVIFITLDGRLGNKTKKAPKRVLLFVYFWLVTDAKNIINGNIMKFRKLY